MKFIESVFSQPKIKVYDKNVIILQFLGYDLSNIHKSTYIKYILPVYVQDTNVTAY